jgi:DNA-binding NtrC family response regulator
MKPVLVVDDEQQIRLLVKTLLSEEGLESIEASNGCSALTAAEKIDGEISLLLTDINMPGSPVNGVELAGAVKSEFPEIPVLFVSSEPSFATDLDSVAPGNVFVKKPFDLRVFAETARKLVTQASESNRGLVRRSGNALRGTGWSRLLSRCSGHPSAAVREESTINKEPINEFDHCPNDHAVCA